MVAVSFLVVKDPEIEVTATAIPGVAVDQVLSILPYCDPEDTITGFEHIFLDTVLCNELPSLIEPVSENIPEALPVLSGYLLRDIQVSKYLFQYRMFPLGRHMM